jgi:hypothetical protein
MFGKLTIGLLLTATSAAAIAQADAAPEKPVTRTELTARLDSDYADLDADKDGKVGGAEIENRLKISAATKIEALKKARDETFAKLDVNGDGSVSRAEFDQKAPLPTPEAPNAKPFLDRFDADKDGNITKEEFRAPTLANFQRLDRNKDGTLTPAEQKAPERQNNGVGR